MSAAMPQSLFTPPSVEGAILRRERLFALLAPSLSRRLTLVLAPAGYGKTTLLADYVAKLDLPVAWYRIIATDRDPRTFSDHLRAAFCLPFPALIRAPQPWLSTIEGRPLAAHIAGSPEADITQLCSDLRATIVEEALLVLDDFYLAETEPICHAFQSFLDTAPPNVHICLLSRRQPDLGLARRRAREELLEITRAQLAFTPDEIETLFTQIYRLPIDKPSLSKLADRSQGWAAGLVLLRDALRKVPTEERAIMLDRLALSQELYDYLADEVWQQQAPRVRRFLLQTAILEPVTPQAATELTGERAPLRILRQMERAGLFVTCENVKIDRSSGSHHPAGTGAYRYHPLLRDFLCKRLQVESGDQAFRELHRRAASFFRAHRDGAEAIAHALDGEDWKAAAEWIEETAAEVLHRGQLATLIGWLERLPDDVLQGQPWLVLWRGRARNLLGENALGESDIIHALALFQTHGDSHGIAAAQVTLAELLFRRGDYVASEQQARSVLAQNIPGAAEERAQASDWLGCSLAERGNVAGAADAFQEALLMHQAQGNLWGQALAYYHLASAALLRGDLRGAEWQSRQALDLFQKLKDFRAALPFLRLSEIHHLRGEENEAANAGNQALRFAEEAQLSLARAYALTYRADALAALGQTEDAEIDYRTALTLGESHREPSMRILPLLGISRLALGTGSPSQMVHRPAGIGNRPIRKSQPDLELAAELWRRQRMTDDPALRGAVLAHLGDLSECRGDAPSAIQYWSQAQDQWHQIEAEHEMTRLKVHQAALALSLGDASWGATLAEAIGISDERGYAFLFVRTERARALPLLAAALAHGVAPERAERLLAQIGCDAIAPLIASLPQAGPAARARIASVLGEIGETQAARHLRRLQRDPENEVRQAAVAALRRIALQPPSPLRLYTLGSFRIARGDEIIAELASGRKAPRRLLKILIAKRREFVSREILIDLLWQEVDVPTGLKRLKALVHDLRRILEPDLVGDEPSSYVTLDGDANAYHLQGSVWLDADEFVTRARQGDRLVRQHLGDEALVEYEAADTLYRGDFMEEDIYEDWCAPERENLRETHLRVLDALAARYLAGNQYDRSADSYHRALGVDPLRESAHRGLMLALARGGRRAEALRQYQTCHQLLVKEIKAEPMPETQALYQRLLRQEPI